MKSNNRFSLLSIFLTIAVLFLGCGAQQVEWPQWQGPTRDNISQDAGLLESWPEGGPKVLWRIPIGEGYSGISISQGRIYTMHEQGDDEFAICLDASSGNEIWRSRTDSSYHSNAGNGPRSTPTVDGKSVFVLGARGKLYALDTENGEKLWEHDFVTEFGSNMPGFGFATSPLVEGDSLLVEVGGEADKSIVAFEKKSGRVVWTSHTDAASYSSPIAITSNGVRQAVFLTSKTLVSVSPTDGKVYWKYIPWPTGNDINAATPIFMPEDKIFVSAAYDKGAVVLQMKPSADGITVEEVWKTHGILENWMSSSVLFDDHLYGFDESILKCIEANTGEQKWAQRGFNRGSLILADGHLIILGENGKLGLVEAAPSEYIEKASAQILQGRCLTVPTLVDGKLYLRNQKEIVCLDLTQKI